MSATSNATAPAAPTITISTGGVLDFLWCRAAPALSDAELKRLAETLPDFIFAHAGQLEYANELLGSALPNNAQASDMLFLAAGHMGLLSSLARIASESAARLDPVCKRHPAVAD